MRATHPMNWLLIWLFIWLQGCDIIATMPLEWLLMSLSCLSSDSESSKLIGRGVCRKQSCSLFDSCCEEH